MVDDIPDFESRLNAALAMNGLDNAKFASALGASGQQKVRQWKNRGRIGSPSLPAVRKLLPRTSMEWLQEGTGPAERLRPGLNPSQRADESDDRHSYAARRDVHTMAKALGVLEAAEFRNGNRKFPGLEAATRLLAYYDRLKKGEGQADLIAQLFNDDQGDGDVQHDEDAGAGKHGR